MGPLNKSIIMLVLNRCVEHFLLVVYEVVTYRLILIEDASKLKMLL